MNQNFNMQVSTYGLIFAKELLQLKLNLQYLGNVKIF